MLDQFFSCYKAPFTLRKDHRSEEYIYIILALYSLQWFIDIARRRKIAAWRVNITNIHNYIEGTKGWHAVCCCASIDIRHEGSISCTCIVRQKGQQVWHEHVVVLAYILFREQRRQKGMLQWYLLDSLSVLSQCWWKQSIYAMRSQKLCYFLD